MGVGGHRYTIPRTHAVPPHFLPGVSLHFALLATSYSGSGLSGGWNAWSDWLKSPKQGPYAGATWTMHLSYKDLEPVIEAGLELRTGHNIR